MWYRRRTIDDRAYALSMTGRYALSINGRYALSITGRYALSMTGRTHFPEKGVIV